MKYLLSVIVLLALCVSAHFVSAADIPLVLAQGGKIVNEGGGKIVSQSRSYVFEALIILVLFGLALFAICRTSHRP